MPEQHPIVTQMDPSSEQEPAISARGRDVVVTAGAGAGKTRTLVARYLALLAEGLPLRSIVAITFTRKAAREMRNRVRDEMRRYLERSDLALGERRRWQDLYTQLDAARIGTIHSLCGEILRAHPAEAGVDPRFEPLDEGPSNILRQQALDEAMAWAADDTAAAALFTLLGERELRTTLAGLLNRRLDVEDAFRGLPADLPARWQQTLAGRQATALAALRGRPAWREAVATLGENQASRPDDRIEEQRRDVLAAIAEASGSPAQQLDSLSRLETIDRTGGSARAWPGGPQQLDAVKQALRTLQGLWKNRPAPLRLAINPQDEALAGSFAALQALFAIACARYDALKRERNTLDFDDLERGALQLLRQDPGVRSRWQDEVCAILVDEFQDTNGRQRDLVALLNGGAGKLFIVADAKQSIYRFRGADVTVFRAERQRIDREGGAVVGLETSYRAHRGLIQGLNNLFRPVLGEAADPERPWAEPFAPLRHHREQPRPGFAPPHLEVHLTVGTKGSGALNRAAAALVWRLMCLRAEGALQDYGEVAILCRASSSFKAYEDALEQSGVPFLTVAGRGFYDRPEIRDLLNALRALADPTDDLALAGLLRSPALGLSDGALYLLRQERRRAGENTLLWDTLRQTPSCLSGADSARAGRAVEIIANLQRKVGRTAVADLLKGFLDVTDYRAALVQAGQGRGARNVAKLLADANSSGIVSVGEFLEYVTGLRESGAREGEARATPEGAVQIMSVHAAKGLEFTLVVLGDITYGGRGGNFMLIDPELGVLLPRKGEDDTLPAIYSLAKERSDDQDAAETDRLLYVAATRAREKLLLNGCIGLHQDGTPGRLGGWLGRLAGAEVLGLEDQQIDYDEQGGRAICLDLLLGQTPVHCTVYEPRWAPPPSSRQEGVAAARSVVLPPPLLAPVLPGVEQVDEPTAAQERIPPRRVWRVVPQVRHPTAPAWVVGSLVHEALAAWRFPGETFARWAEARARSYGITAAQQLKNAATESARLLRRFQAHALFREMDGAERRLHEVPYSLLVDGRLESGIMDVLYLREGIWTVIEFKTDEVHDQAQLEALLAGTDYRAQAQRYAAAVERLLGQRPRVILCLLNYAGQVYLI